MEKIALSKKRIVELTINDKEYIATLDNYTILHFQMTTKKGFLDAISDLQGGDITIVSQLLASLIRDKETGKIVGLDFINQFDFMEVLEHLSPVIGELVDNNLPEAKDESEGK